jgi:hypothetical protein
MKDDIVRVLTEAKKLVEAGWTKEVYARNSAGVEVPHFSDEACSFCAFGAIYRVGDKNLELAEECEQAINNIWFNAYEASSPALTLGEWNDLKSTTKEDVLKFFDYAIQEISEGTD